jgi:hypothetical protein
MTSSKIRFVVVEGNILGFILPELPLSVQILSSSIIRGASVSWMDGSYPLPLDPERVRPATRDDFKEFRIDPEPYARQPQYYHLAA